MNKKHIFLSLVIIFTLGLFLFPSQTYAIDILGGVRDGVAQLLWNVTFVLLNVFLYILQFVGTLFEAVAGVQNFFSDGVNAAWEATRDFANLFFALMLLFIAIATVLGMNQYSAKNMLPKFFVAALFINFSKALVGVLIDISQIIMFEFYNALGGNITNNAVNFSQITYFHDGVPSVGGREFELYMNGVILNLVMILLIVILIFAFIWGTLTLAIRLVTLWVLISLSPIAFVSMIVPPLSGAFNEWKKSLSEQLVKGPAFMFFVWLAFIVLNATTDTLYTPTNDLAGNGLDSSFTTFFTDGGPFIGFTLTAIFLFMANTIAEKAATAAPGVGGKLAGAVGKYGGVATLGIGGYMGLSKVKTFGKGSEGLAQNAKSVAMDAGKVGTAGLALSTAGGATAVLGGGALAAGAYNLGKNTKAGYMIRRDTENLKEDWKKGKVLGSRILSGDAKEHLYGEWKKEQDKLYAERELSIGSSEYDKKAWSRFKKAEAAASGELKDVNDNDVLISEMGQAKDIATRRAALKKLAGNKDGLSNDNLDKIAKELGITFEEDSDRTSKIEQVAKVMDFKNKNYSEQNKEHRQDIANALSKEGDYTYNPEELAKGTQGQDSVVAYLKNKDAKKKISSMNGRNFTSKDSKGETVFNQKRFDAFMETMSENELQNERLYENLPQRKDWEQWMKQSYPNPKSASPKVQVFYNQVVHGSASGPKQSKKAGAPTHNNTPGVDPNDMNNPFNTAAVGQTSTGGVNQEDTDD
jgi:hypothetical protein